PESTAKIWNQLGLGDISRFDLSSLKWAQLPLGGKLGKVEPVFPRADKSAIERMQKMEQDRTTAASTQPPAASSPAGEGARLGGTPHSAILPPAPSTTLPATQAVPGPGQAASAPSGAAPATVTPATKDGKITIDDFLKVELRVGQV